MAATPRPRAQGDELASELARVDEALVGANIRQSAQQLARRHAQALYRSTSGGSEAVALARLTYAAELLSAMGVDLAADAPEARRLILNLHTRAGIPSVALGREVLHSGALLEVPVDVALEARLALLIAFTGARSAALCVLLAGDQLQVISQAGEGRWESPEYGEVIRELFRETAPRQAHGHLLTVARVERLRPPPALLIAEGVELSRDEGELLLAAAAPILSVLLDREVPPVARAGGNHEGLLGSVERRLARLRFDLHDGPQQDVHLLAQDLALFRAQLRPMVAGNPNAGRLLGRLDDLEAQLVALDGDLRRLSTAVQSPLLLPGSLADALRTVTEAFAARTGIEPDVHWEGPHTELSDSQQIALLSLIREALSNIRKHSNAHAVGIRVSADATGVHVEVRDDGDGFDPEETLLVAARAGRLGLVGMHERVRMLGGRTHIDSRPGGPTVISATLPPWPAGAAAEGGTANG
jgi:signal transduction histidine kinase